MIDILCWYTAWTLYSLAVHDLLHVLCNSNLLYAGNNFTCVISSIRDYDGLHDY